MSASSAPAPIRAGLDHSHRDSHRGDEVARAAPGFVLVGLAPDTRADVVDLAARIADHWHRDLVLAHATADPGLADAASSARSATRSAAVVRRLRDRPGPHARVSTHAMTGATVPALVRAGARAGLLVLGSQRDAGDAEVVHLDVVAHVASLATCPVLVVHADHGTPPPAEPVPGPITVDAGDDTGDDTGDDEGSRTALRTAFALASATGRALRVLGDPGRADLVLRVAQLRREHPHVAADLTWPADAPVGATGVAATAGTAAALVAASVTSSLLVVGRGAAPGRTSGASLAAVTRVLLREARCPVLVAVAPRTEPGLEPGPELGPYAEAPCRTGA